MRPQPKDPLQEAIDQACNGRAATLHAFLERHGALPGPRPNLKLAKAAAVALVAKGPAGAQLLLAMRKLGPGQAAEKTSGEFLPVVGVLAIGVDAARTVPDRIAAVLTELQPFSEDPRLHVRGAVIPALREVLEAHKDDAVRALQTWTDGYLQGCAALDAIAEPVILQHMKAPGELVARLQEAFDMIEQAPRSHERSQGYRALLRAIGATPAIVGKRFPAEVARWLEERATTQHPELREMIEKSIHAMRGAGVRHADLEQAQRALQDSQRAPRDPRSYVGPTRSRGKKARSRGAQK